MYTQDNDFFYIPKDRHEKSSFMNYFYNDVNKYTPNPQKTIKRLFSIVYHDGYFLEAVYSILVEYETFSGDGICWSYPDLNSPFPEDHFDGIVFSIGFDDPDYTVYVSEQTCFEYTKLACERFMKIHPEKKYQTFLMNIINNWRPLNEVS
ncbi:hypothetical protein HMPREF0198_1701 [Cardiobacterium hominis ATCC 15826]|uniref:CDI immunity protein domain-containing protein n=2 Tax=Cardiobacterium hominis TaxID=2718 RepID=C8NB23_CARH6|nr:hypothetical protein HMPREF0198_1701 [Cardiobacterium hominis ATCC 15826]